MSKNPQDKEDWQVDEPAAEVVRKIYALCLDGRGPSQIARQLEQENALQTLLTNGKIPITHM